MKMELTMLETKHEQALALLDEWCADSSHYDEPVWLRLKDRIEENRLSERKRFDDTCNAGFSIEGSES